MYDASGAGRRGRCRCEELSVLLSVRLPACPAAVEVARHQVRGVLELYEADAVATDDAELLTSELVTNAVVHVGRERPGAELGLSLIRDGGSLLVEVHDPSRELPYVRDEVGELQESGRGLLMVATVAHDHGVHLTEGAGKVVWFELIAWPVLQPT
ncbi:ATP-binding protein [Actinomadura fulvescens]|uniref:Histidine kinase/HSP90-like ATPase domain-containing protein n=1 Tax=Actinomadura fulvescens TaxID=46160 RepID=A0ABN3QAV7_9ACTN